MPKRRGRKAEEPWLRTAEISSVKAYQSLIASDETEPRTRSTTAPRKVPTVIVDAFTSNFITLPQSERARAVFSLRAISRFARLTQATTREIYAR